MVFSSISFLFFFLPTLFIIYFLTPKKYRNYILLLFSLIFYIFGEKWYVILLITSCLINYICGILIEKKNKKLFLIIGLIINIALLLYYKYTNFFLDTFTNIFNLNPITLNIILPLGISFFTFQNISYLIDVYRKDVNAQRNFLKYATYITLFPQLVAGPIVRYKDVADELENREENTKIFSEGVIRFIVGLSKKVLIADTIYYMYTEIMKTNMTTLSYWLVAIGFTLQIYYDFSGYTDMAIGLGKMFGFNFKENFNYPLISSSITEFWRRWHISLSSFFKDYVYIPLGGNRCSKLKNIRNILIVWTLTGFWHGASWNFILWGLYFFIFLILEKFILKKYLRKGFFSHLYTLIVVIISFVIFSLTNMTDIFNFIKGMFGINTIFINHESIYHLKNNLVIILIALLGSGPIIKNTIIKLKKGKYNKLIECLFIIFIFTIFILSIAKIVSSSFNPFIYFRF